MGVAIVDGQYAQLANGTRLHFASAGTRGRPLVLMLHGFPEAWFAWESLMAVLGTEHFVVAPDLRGFNLSSKPADVGAYRAKHLVDDVRLLVESLGYKSCELVAHDWGGAVAWNVAIFLPALVRQLIIVNAPHPYLFMKALASDAIQQRSSAYMNWLRAPGSEEALAADDFARMDSVFANATWYTEARRKRYHQAWSIPGDNGSHGLTGSVNYYRATPLHPPGQADSGAAAIAMERDAWQVNVPVRVIWGDGDTALAPILVEGLDTVCPHLHVTRIPDGSHWIIHEQPARVAALISDYLLPC